MIKKNSNNIDEPIYKYYIETVSTKHYPTATELAQYIGIYSEYGKLYPAFITAYMDSIGADKVYYFGKNGKVRIINDWGMVIQMLVLLDSKIRGKKDNSSKPDLITIKIGKRNYHLRVEEKKVRNALKVAFETDKN